MFIQFAKTFTIWLDETFFKLLYFFESCDDVTFQEDQLIYSMDSKVLLGMKRVWLLVPRLVFDLDSDEGKTLAFHIGLCWTHFDST